MQRRGQVWSTCYTCTIGWMAASSAILWMCSYHWQQSQQPSTENNLFVCWALIQNATSTYQRIWISGKRLIFWTYQHTIPFHRNTFHLSSIIPVDSHCQIRGVADISYPFKRLAFLCNRLTQSVKGLAVGSSPRGKGIIYASVILVQTLQFCKLHQQRCGFFIFNFVKISKALPWPELQRRTTVRGCTGIQLRHNSLRFGAPLMMEWI